MAIHRLPKSSTGFGHSLHSVRSSNANQQIASRAERAAAASNVAQAVESEAALLRAGDQPDELARVRRRIAAYCEDYPGLDAVVASVRRRLGVPEQAAEDARAEQPQPAAPPARVSPFERARTTLGATEPVPPGLTLGQLLDHYDRRDTAPAA